MLFLSLPFRGGFLVFYILRYPLITKRTLFFHLHDKLLRSGYFLILLFLKKLDYAQLTQLKWILTVLFYLIYFGITYLLISAIFKNKTYNLITIASHLVFFLIAGIFYLVGVFTGKGLEGYTLSREFMGILQSPLLLMILIPTFILSDRQKNLQKDINR
jgi:hypothetical protein